MYLGHETRGKGWRSRDHQRPSALRTVAMKLTARLDQMPRGLQVICFERCSSCPNCSSLQTMISNIFIPEALEGNKNPEAT